MTFRQKMLPSIPDVVPVLALSKNLKLYSEREIHDIKSRFKKNGRYRHYVDASGMSQTLKYPLCVLDGQYYASFPCHELAEQTKINHKLKVAQNLDSGEWLNEDIFTDMTQVEFAQRLPLSSNGLFRIKKSSPVVAQQYFGGNLEAVDPDFELIVTQPDSGKAHLFSKREGNHESVARGVNNFVNVGILDVNVFYESCGHGADYLAQCIQDLRAYHFVFLCDPNDETSDIDLLAVKRKLETHGIMVSLNVLTEAPQKIRQILASYEISTTKGHDYNIELITSSQVVPEDVRIMLSDSEEEPDNNNDALLGADAAESYQLCECLTWFFRSLATDICQSLATPLQGRFDIFSHPTASEEQDKRDHYHKML